MSIMASHLEIGDMVNLEGDSVFDPACEFDFCVFKSENAELSDIEPDGEFLLRLTFRTEYTFRTETVPLTHDFADPE